MLESYGEGFRIMLARLFISKLFCLSPAGDVGEGLPVVPWRRAASLACRSAFCRVFCSLFALSLSSWSFFICCIKMDTFSSSLFFGWEGSMYRAWAGLTLVLGAARASGLDLNGSRRLRSVALEVDLLKGDKVFEGELFGEAVGKPLFALGKVEGGSPLGKGAWTRMVPDNLALGDP